MVEALHGGEGSSQIIGFGKRHAKRSIEKLAARRNVNDIPALKLGFTSEMDEFMRCGF